MVPPMLQEKKPTILDLFCGCSGLGLGARNAGFDVKLSIDVDDILTSSYSRNFPNGKLLLADVRNLNASLLKEKGLKEIDGIIGGPPCQGFSSIGKNMPNDPRRELVWHFFRLVNEIKPKFFLMENVKGLSFAKNRHVLDEALSQLSGHYTVLGPLTLDVANYGGATRRPRVFVFGFDKRSVSPILEQEIASMCIPAATVRDAIYDLNQVCEAGSYDGFDKWIYPSNENVSPYAKMLRGAQNYTTGLKKTPHKEEIVQRFASLKPGETDKIGRHPKLKWDGQCPTLRAGTGSDKGSFQAVRPIHPEEPRVITVREAARIQGFPDWFMFHPTIWHSFRMIGNSVSPLIAEPLLRLVLSKISSERQGTNEENCYL